MNTEHPKKPSPVASDAKWYPVRAITFVSPTSVPGGPARSELAGNVTQTNVARWTIEYAPSMRHFKITHYTTTVGKEPQVCMVPETAVKSWEPMP